MTGEEHAKLIDKILKAGGDGNVIMQAATELTADYTQMLSSAAKSTADIEVLTDKVQTVQDYNFKLLKQIPSDPNYHYDTLGKPKEDPDPKKEFTFENLFDEKGELK